MSQETIQISETIKLYSDVEREEIVKYINQLDETQKKIYLIALNHLGTSFNIQRSNGFKAWQKKNSIIL
jgi:hypothetical protein